MGPEHSSRPVLAQRQAMRRMLLILVVAGLLVGATAAPAFAFIHELIPAGQCAASDQAGDNETAEAHLPRVPIETPRRPRRSSALERPCCEKVRSPVFLGSAPSSYPYSPECVEGVFSEVRMQDPG